VFRDPFPFALGIDRGARYLQQLAQLVPAILQPAEHMLQAVDIQPLIQLRVPAPGGRAIHQVIDLVRPGGRLLRLGQVRGDPANAIGQGAGVTAQATDLPTPGEQPLGQCCSHIAAAGNNYMFHADCFPLSTNPLCLQKFLRAVYAMTLTELRYIVTLAQEQHFGHAAERCHVSQPTLSVGVKKLEEELGIMLFERTKSAVRVTPVGEKIVAQAQRVLEEAMTIRELASAGKNQLSAPLKVGAIYTIGPYLFPHLIPQLHRVAPEMPLYIEENYTHVLR